MKGLKYLIIAFLTAVTFTLGTTPGMARNGGHGGGHKGGHGGFHGGHRGGHHGHGYRGGHHHNYYYGGYGYYNYYWPYLIPPLVLGTLFYYQYQRPVYYPSYPNPVNQQVIISPQAQAPAQTPQTQAVPQEQSGTYQIIVKDRYGNPQTVNIPRGQTVTISEGKDGELQINFEEQPTSQQPLQQGNTFAENYENGSSGYGSGIPLKQTDAFGMGW